MTKTIELFSGTKSFSKIAKAKGFETLTIDNDIDLSPDVLCDILSLSLDNPMFKERDILWASPPCTAFSVASVYHHWRKSIDFPSENQTSLTRREDIFIPLTRTANIGLELLDKTISIISKNSPKLWYIENPRGMMRKMIDKIFVKYNIVSYRRVTVTYCQYGDSRMKPTDIWTNDIRWRPHPPCNNGDKCHVSAPRGSRTGTQGLKGAKERGVIPPSLFVQILEDNNL